MVKVYKLVIASAVVTLTAGCASTDFMDIMHDGELSYIQPNKVNNIAHYPGTGGVIISNGRDKDNAYVKDVCVAPPAQAAQEITLKILSTLAAQASTKGVDANLTASRNYDLTTSISKLYEQNERTLLLQYSLYRLCEAHMNGMFDPYENPTPELLKQRNENQKDANFSQIINQRLEQLKNAENKIAVLMTEREELLNQNDANNTSMILQKDQEIRNWKSLYYKNTYSESFNKILDTAVRLAELDKDKAVAEAEHARYVKAAEKEKEDANQKIATVEQKVNAAENKAKDTQGQLDQIENKLIDKALNCVDCKDNNKSSVKK